MFLDHCKYPVKDKKMHEYITDIIEIFSDSDREDSDKKKTGMKKNIMKKIKYRMHLILYLKYFEGF